LPTTGKVKGHLLHPKGMSAWSRSQRPVRPALERTAINGAAADDRMSESGG
jgi:hypothetical protein